MLDSNSTSSHIVQILRFILLLMVALIGACSSVAHNYRVVGPQDTSKAARLIYVAHPFKTILGEYPSGSYTLVGQDDKGYFYQAQQKIVAHWTIGGTTLNEAGIYLRTPISAQAYIIEGERPMILPANVSTTTYSFQHQP